MGEWYWVGYVAGGLAIILAGLAFWMFTTSLPTIYPWLLHLASIVLLVIAGAWLDGAKRNRDEHRIPWTRLEIGILLAIFAIAAFMRLYRFDQIPFGTWYDEADYGLNALRIINRAGLPARLCRINRFTVPFYFPDCALFSNPRRFNPVDPGRERGFRSGDGGSGIFYGPGAIQPQNGFCTGILVGRCALGYQLEPDRHARRDRAIL